MFGRYLTRRPAPSQPLTAYTPVVTSNAVWRGNELVRLVAHLYDDKPLWLFLSKRETADGDSLVVHAEHLLERDARLAEVARLQKGTVAVREERSAPWRTYSFKTNDEYDRRMAQGDFD